MAVFEVNVDDFLILSQEDDHSPFAEYLTQVLALQDLVRHNKLIEKITQRVNFTQTVSPRNSITSRSVSDYLELHNQGAPGQSISIIDIFFMWDKARYIDYFSIVDTLTFTETIVANLCKAGSSIITFTQSAVCTIVRNLTIVDTLSMSSSGTSYMDDLEKYSITLPTITGPNTPEC